MNGRIYDPLLGRFLSADIVVQSPSSLQSYNRYSYVQNNPLTYTDPTGFYLQFQEQAMIDIDRRAAELGVTKEVQAGRTAATVGVGIGVFGAPAVPALVGATGATGWLATGLGILGDSLLGGLAGGSSQATHNVLTGQPIGENVPKAAGWGMFFGGLFSGLSRFVDAVVPGSNPSPQNSSTAAGTTTTAAADVASTPTPAVAPIEGTAPSLAPTDTVPASRPTMTVDGTGKSVPVNNLGVPSRDFEPKQGVGPYSRPSAAGPTTEQTASVQGRPCAACGETTPRQIADHRDPLVVEHYRTGTNNLAKQTSTSAVQPHCPACSSKQGGQLSSFSRAMKQKLVNGQWVNDCN